MDGQIVAAIIGFAGVIGVAVVTGLVGIFRQGREISSVQKAAEGISEKAGNNGVGIKVVKDTTKEIHEAVKATGNEVGMIKDDIRDFVIPGINEINGFVTESRALRNSAASGGVDPMKTIADIQTMAASLVQLQEKAIQREKELQREIDQLKEQNRELRDKLRMRQYERENSGRNFRDLDEPEL